MPHVAMVSGCTRGASPPRLPHLLGCLASFSDPSLSMSNQGNVLLNCSGITAAPRHTSHFPRCIGTIFMPCLYLLESNDTIV